MFFCCFSENLLESFILNTIDRDLGHHEAFMVIHNDGSLCFPRNLLDLWVPKVLNNKISNLGSIRSS